VVGRKDQLIRFLLPGAHTRGAIIRAENIVKDASQIHGLNDVPAEMFGNSLIASILLLSISKGGVRQVLQLDAHPDQPHTPIKRLLTEARSGMVRGFLNWNESGGLQTRNQHEHGVSSWMGKPIRTTVIRDLGIGQPYISSTEHDSDYMADHILHFLTQSAQVQSEVILHGNLGIMLEAMPGSDQEHWFKGVEALAKISNERLYRDEPKLLLEAFTELGCKVVGEDEYSYHCNCKAETLITALQNIPTDQLRELASDAGTITLSCQYCNSSYEVDIPSEDI
jgi:molecular chaperone Hsp33